MHYFNWNNAIGCQLFNAQRANQPVYICLTQEQIINAGRQYDPVLAEVLDTDVWEDFRKSINRFFDEKKYLVELINEAALKRGNRVTVGNTTYQTAYPPYLSLLVLAVLPLTDEQVHLNANNYYQRASNFLSSRQVPTIRSQNDQTNWLVAWEKLERWSKQTKHGELGVFELNRFTANNYKYVGKVFAQCLMPPKSRTLLPKLFAEMDWVPKQYRSYENYRDLLERCQTELGVREWVLQAVRRGNDELGQSVVRQLAQAYDRWSGRTDMPIDFPAAPSLEVPDQATYESTHKGFTYSRLYLTFKDPHYNNDQLEPTFRLRTENTFPESLHFGGQTCLEERYGWSQVLELSFFEGLKVEDSTNKWRARFPFNAIRVFERGSMHGLSRDYWVEVDTLSKIHDMIVMCDVNEIEQIHTWGKHFPIGRFNERQAGEWFEENPVLKNYRFFACQGPTQRLNEQFGLPTLKAISLKGGLKLSNRAYYADYLPVTLIHHGDGTEKIVVEYDDKTVLPLMQDAENLNLYHLPKEQIRTNCNVWFSIVGESVRSEIAYQFCAETLSDEVSQPVRDVWGRIKIVPDASSPHCEGMRLQGINTAHQQPYLAAFYPGLRPNEPVYKPNKQSACPGDELLAYLTGRRQGKADYFNRAFDTINRAVQQNYLVAEKPLNRWSLSAYDTLGFLDYNYERGTFTVAEPAFIPLPTRRGRRALLVGSRTTALTEKIQDEAARHGIIVSVETQSRPELMLPSVITLMTDDSATQMGCQTIQQVAEAVGIPYLCQTLPQWGLLQLSGKISAFDAQFLAIPDETAASLGWLERVFNPDTLAFDPPTGLELDRQLTFIRYELHSWQQHYLLWIDGRGYPVERDWGRYALLARLKKQVIYKSEQSKNVAVPATLPLPRLLARAFTLTSGKLPLMQPMNLDGRTRNYLIYKDTGLLADNHFRDLGQTIQSTTVTF